MTGKRTALLGGLAFVLAVGIGGSVLLPRLYVYQPADALIGQGDSATPMGEIDPRVLARERRDLRALVPRGVYVVVDTSRNRLYVKKGEETLLEAVCSTGSGVLLRDPDTDRSWFFDTPKGRFEVLRKKRDPVWTKPDWAFVEEGKPLPRSWSERRDDETLGDYALYFGDGYMIHGTLYQRYLGRSITHGCVRLGDADLARVYELTPLGAPIYIF